MSQMELDLRSEEQLDWDQIRSEMMASVAKMVDLPATRLAPIRHIINMQVNITPLTSFKDILT